MALGQMYKAKAGRQSKTARPTATALRVAKSALRKANKLEGLFEQKYYDVAVTRLQVGNDGTVANNILQVIDGNLNPGFQANERVGDRCTATYLEFRGHTYLPSGATQAFVRLLLVRFEEGNGQTLNEVLQQSGAGGKQYQSLYHVENAGEYQVLADKTINLKNYAYSGSASTTSDYRMFDMKVPISKRKFVTGKIQFEQSTATVKRGNIVLFMVTNYPAGPNAPTIDGTIRIKYTDA